MVKELVVDVVDSSISIALLEDSSLVEYNRDSMEHSFAVGNIYIGRVRKLLPGLNAAFVDIGSEREAFIHYHDLGQQFSTFNAYIQQIWNNRKITPKIIKKTELPKDGAIQDVLKQGDYIMVQIIKEAINTKGPRLTCEISIAGRNMVLLPLGEKVSVSSKIKTNDERSRLRKIVQSIKRPSSGVIIRTLAVDKQIDELDSELRVMERRWEKVIENLRASKTFALLYEEQSRVVSLLRDLLTPEFESVYVNDKGVYDEICSYVDLIAPDKSSIVKLYNDSTPIFDHFGITRQVKSLFGRTVSFKRGAYLIMDKAEAMHVIDVNSGARAKADQSQEQNAIEVNLAAADEIARQLRLRDLGGIIVIDFIDMIEASNRTLLYEHMQQIMKTDRAKHNILPLTKFGLMQITRQRVRPATEIDTTEVCPVCMGTGKIKPALLLTDQIEESIPDVIQAYNTTKFNIIVHPFVYAFLHKGLFSIAMRWKLKYGFGVQVKQNQSLGIVSYLFEDKKGEELTLRGVKAMLADK